jgi:hypothetical protein
MATSDDDDFLAAPIANPDAEPTAAERAHAKTFAAIVDKTLAGRTPPAMSADDRALLEVATVIRAANGKLELTASKTRSLVDDALRQSIGEAAASQGLTPMRRPVKRWLPWVVGATSTLIAAAAILMLWLRPARQVRVETGTATPASWRSRPTDPLIGPIPRANAGDAGARIDYIFADRLDGYRERQFARSGGKP